MAAYARLTNSICGEFADVSNRSVIDAVMHAYEATDLFGLTEDDRIPMVRTIARQSLLERRGDVISSARLNPERHRPRASPEV